MSSLLFSSPVVSCLSSLCCFKNWDACNSHLIAECKRHLFEVVPELQQTFTFMSCAPSQSLWNWPLLPALHSMSMLSTQMTCNRLPVRSTNFDCCTGKMRLRCCWRLTQGLKHLWRLLPTARDQLLEAVHQVRAWQQRHNYCRKGQLCCVLSVAYCDWRRHVEEWFEMKTQPEAAYCFYPQGFFG